METFALCNLTGNQQVNEVLCGIISILETTFLGRIRAFYLHGSFIDKTAIATSDIDLFLVLKGKFTAEERENIQRIIHFSSLFSPFMVEVIMLDETSLLQNGHFRIKSASSLLWGDDLRGSMPEQKLDQYIRLYAHFPFLYIAQMLRNVEAVAVPLSYPQPTGDFYGYDQQQLPPRNERRHNIKKLVTSVCWISTVFIAWNAGKTIRGKNASVQMYREYVHDEWTTFIEEVYEWGNRQWHYLVPSEPEERRRLRDFCAQTLAFENHYLSHYKAYLLAELQKNDEHKLIAMQRLRSID